MKTFNGKLEVGNLHIKQEIIDSLSPMIVDSMRKEHLQVFEPNFQKLFVLNPGNYFYSGEKIFTNEINDENYEEDSLSFVLDPPELRFENK